ncbi:hypothetical protein AVEN_50517-1 [Araneus ventricosus]|uniref:Uncharacterized protein n=1 Tax=Araneus ventricosus TaxID=182803 RepID=A0A4Y2AQ98_ARAVE|nr:hypothetical protein AVEN_50517-1 [Araneus ventricosus]
MGLEMDKNDIDELVEEHNQELTTEDLKEFHCVSEQEAGEERSVTENQQSSSSIRKFLQAWKTVASYIEKHHPNKAMAMCAIHLFNDNAMGHQQSVCRWRCLRL